jgi:drug/metabolite transporter (DMT)-like permease
VLYALVAVALGDAGPPDDARAWVAVVWLAVLSTIGGYATYWLNVRRGSVTRVSSLLYLTPPTTMLWAALMFGEPVGVVELAGLVVCAVAVLLVRRVPRQGREAPSRG